MTGLVGWLVMSMLQAPATEGLALATSAGTPPVPAALVAQDRAHPSAAELARTLDTYFTRASAFGFSGAVLLAEKGEVVLEQGYGLADRGSGVALTAGAPFHIGSLAKQFTAAAVLRLEADGRLSTDDRLDRFFPDAPEDKRAITLHQLLSHTSGLPYLTARSFMEVRPRAEVMSEMLELPLQAEPGARYAYSNPGYTLLAGVIEQVSGESYERYLERAIFEPAGLRNTGFADDAARWAGTGVRSYSGGGEAGEPLSGMRPLPKAVGAGTVVSTVSDLYRWDRALLGDAVLPGSARSRLFGEMATIGEGRHYGYGWMITRTPRGETLVHHAGDLGGFNAELRRYAEPDLVLIVASNARIDGGGYRTLATNALAYLLNGQDLSMPPAVLPVADTGTGGREGEYRVGPGTSIHVRPAARGLIIGGTGETVLSALAASDPDARERGRVLSERAATVASALAAGNVEPLREHLHRSLSFEGTSRWLVDAAASVADSLGAFRGVRSLGTAVLSETAARSYFHLLFERGSYPVMYGWSGDRIMSFDADYAVPMETLFLPTGERSFASYDLFTGRTVVARFSEGGSDLTISGEGASVTGAWVQSNGGAPAMSAGIIGMSTTFAVLLAAGALLTAAAPRPPGHEVGAAGIIIRHDRDDDKFRALGQRFIDVHVETRVPGRDGAPGPTGNGMGTLIAPTWVLTAAHVAVNFAPGHRGNRSSGEHMVTINGKDYRVARVVLHPDYVRRPSRQADIALIQLAEPAANHRYVELYREQDEVGREVIFVGSGDFGTGRAGPAQRDRTLRGATNRVDRANQRTLYFTFDPPGSDNVTELEGISGPGDSGGGAFIERGGRLYIVGVSCCQDHQGTEGLYGVTEIYPRVSFYAAWIDRVMRGEE